MAKKDVQEYFYTMLAQYIEEKQNLEDFAAALADGLITEDQMQEATDVVASLEENYHRLAYIMYLLNMPNKKDKKIKYIRQNKTLLDTFQKLGVDIDSVENENADALTHFKAILAKLDGKNEP